MTLAPRLLSLSLLLLCAAAAPAQTTPQTPRPAPPTVTASVTASGMRFAAFGAVKQTRLEVYDTSGAVVFDSGLLPGNVRDFSPRAAGLADGTYTCVLTSREVSGRLSLKQAAVALSGGVGSLALGEAEAAGGADRAASPAAAGEGAGAATLSTHDGRDGALTSTAGALTLRTGDVLSGAEREHVRVTPDGRVGIGTDKPEVTLDVAGAVRAAGGFRFPDGTTLTSRAGRLSLTSEAGDELPGPSAAGTGTQNRLAKWAETGGAGALTDSAVIESGGEVIIGSSGNTTGRISMYALPGQVPDVRLLSTAVFNRFLFGNAFPSDLGARLTFAGANEGGLAAQGFSDTNAPAFRFQGHIGTTVPTQFPVVFEGFKWDGSDGRAPLGATEKVFGFYNGAFDAGGTVLMSMTGNGNVGVGTNDPKARLQVQGGNVYVGTGGQGVILKSPDGTVCRLLSIDNAGTLVTSTITCP